MPPPAKVITPSEYQSLADVRYEIRRFLNFSDAAARSAGIEPQQHQLLLALKALPAGARSTIGVLAERLQLHHNSAVELAGRCVDAGLMKRERGSEDRREVSLRITARGARVLERLSIAHRDELRSAAPVLLSALESLVTIRPQRARAVSRSAKRVRGAKS